MMSWDGKQTIDYAGHCGPRKEFGLCFRFNWKLLKQFEQENDMNQYMILKITEKLCLNHLEARGSHRNYSS